MSRSDPQRGMTIAELLSVTAVLGLLVSSVAFIIGPLLRSQSHTQAKVDTVQAAAMALYRLERDLRNSSVDQIFACTTSGLPVCTSPPAAPAPTQAIVIGSAFQNGLGAFQLAATGLPKWQGATVYWIDALGNLDVAFDPSPPGSIGSALTLSQAGSAVTDVTSRGGMQLARFVEKLSLGAPPGSEHVITIQLQAQSTVNTAVNETTYETDVEARNRTS